MEILADMVKSSKFSKEAVEAQKTTSLAALTKQDDPRDFILKNIHYTAYRDHMISQPIQGNVKSIPNITSESVSNYKRDLFIGSRMVIAATGAIDHPEFA